jgi:CBS domain containing-hemolysin-like protein
MQIPHENILTYFSREEFEILLRENNLDKDASFEEKNYIDNVLSLSATKVKEVMIPRTHLSSIDIDSVPDEVYQSFQNSGSFYHLVYKKNLDNIAGVIFIQDLFTDFLRLNEITKPIYIVPLNKGCAPTLREMQKKNVSLALVVDEYGGTAGIVTRDDLIEEVFGKLEEGKSSTTFTRKLNKNTWIVNAQTDIQHINKVTGLHIPEGEYETIAGFLLNRIGKIPELDEVFIFGNFRIEIVKSTPRRVEIIKIVKAENI